MPSLIIHGHFYQPPRENPWTGQVEREPSAAPYHDWNERIHAECYRANAFAKVVSRGLKSVVNNYAHISFNFGPTLLSWLERHHLDTYQRILDADKESVAAKGDHGNAIAQGYGHAILPLCNERDRETQIVWGIADFEHRFGREPESLWLPETAANDATLEALIDHGLRYVILAPQQARRWMSPSSGVWHTAANEKIDPTRVYRYLYRDGSGRSLAVFFYDGALAQAIAFEKALTSSQELIHRFEQAAQKGSLVHVATDGETYGHHFKFGDLCLAHALTVEAPKAGFRITNYGEYLVHHQPEFDVEIDTGAEGEGSSWSCVHGVSRWIRDCGCQTGGEPGGNQKWRTPLRRALDYLRDENAKHFEATRGELFIDPWSARNESIKLVLDPHYSREEFLREQAGRWLSSEEQQRALGFLELQRMCLLMYASCGWFFNDISGIETIQVLKYAARAIDLMDQLGLPPVRDQFLEILAEAKSNKPDMGTGADIFLRFCSGGAIESSQGQARSAPPLDQETIDSAP